MKEKKLIPKRRFNEFINDEAWEQRKLGELVEWSRGSSLPKSVINDKKIGTDVIHYADLYKFSPVINDVIHWSENEEGTIIPKNSLLFPMSDVTPIGLARTSTITKNGVKAGGDTLIGTLDESINAEFMSYQINANAKDIIPFVTGTTVRHISSNSLNKLNVSITNIEEQMKISRLLNKLRNLITLHQRKLKKLKNLKLAYLSEMFPKEGEKYPKQRFAGFTEPWEQRKLKEFGKSTGGTSIESEFVEGGKYKVISIGSYSEQSVYTDQNIRTELTDKTRNRVLNKGDLTMILNDKTASGNIIGRVLLIDSNDSYVYNQRTERIEPDHKKYDSQFLYHMLNAPTIRSKIIKQAQGNTQIYVNWSAIGELDYLIPNLDEQQKIGTFFSSLDHLITLHQRKLEKLENLKKAYLNEMFV